MAIWELLATSVMALEYCPNEEIKPYPNQTRMFMELGIFMESLKDK